MIFILKLCVFILFQVVVSEELTDSESDLCFSPSCSFESDVFYLLKVGCSKSKNTLNQLVVLNFAPVMAFFYVEVLEIERSIFRADVFVA